MKKFIFLSAMVLGTLTAVNTYAQTDSLHLKVKRHKIKEDVKAVPHQDVKVVHDVVPVPVPVATPEPAPEPAKPEQTTINVNTPPPAPEPAPERPKETTTTTTTTVVPVQHTAAVKHTTSSHVTRTTRTSAQLRRRSANTHYTASNRRPVRAYKTTTTTKVVTQ